MNHHKKRKYSQFQSPAVFPNCFRTQIITAKTLLPMKPSRWGWGWGRSVPLKSPLSKNSFHELKYKPRGEEWVWCGGELGLVPRWSWRKQEDGQGAGGPFGEIQHYTHYLPTEITSGKAQIHPGTERSTPRSCLPSRVVPHRPVVVCCYSFGIYHVRSHLY